MEMFLIDAPIPSMGATANELIVVNMKARVGDRISKGQKLAELESDKSIFEFESPCGGVITGILAKPGDVRSPGAAFFRIETNDVGVRHLEVKVGTSGGDSEAAAAPSVATAASALLIWTPRATKLAQEAGLDPAAITDIEGTGPGGRISGDDVTNYIAHRNS